MNEANLAFSKDKNDIENDIEFVIGNIAIAITCYFQGMERLIKCVLSETGLKEPGYGHKLLKSYEELKNKSSFLKFI